MNPVYILTSSSVKILVHFNNLISYILRSAKWTLPLGFSDENFICTSNLSHACCM